MSIDYELVKKLKDAGFPQTLDGNKTLSGKPMKFYGKEGEPYVPTLEELIDACTDDGTQLIKSVGGVYLAEFIDQV